MCPEQIKPMAWHVYLIFELRGDSFSYNVPSETSDQQEAWKIPNQFIINKKEIFG